MLVPLQRAHDGTAGERCKTHLLVLLEVGTADDKLKYYLMIPLQKAHDRTAEERAKQHLLVVLQRVLSHGTSDQRLMNHLDVLERGRKSATVERLKRLHMNILESAEHQDTGVGV